MAEKTMNFDERRKLINEMSSHVKKLEMLKQLKSDVQFDISMNLQMAQLADMSSDAEMPARVLNKLNELSKELDIITNDVLKEEHDIDEYDWKKHHPVKSAVDDAKDNKKDNKKNSSKSKKTTGKEHKSSKSSEKPAESAPAEEVEAEVVEEEQVA